MYNSALLTLASLASPSLAAYAKVWDYNSSNFLDAFNFIDKSDMSFTKGFAQYVGIDEATSSGLYSVVDSKVRLSVDSSNKYSTSSTGRKSLRLQSWGYFDNGLLVGDFAHVPVAGCGMWPAFWVYQGETSPTYSEIDILENVNLQSANSHSFYTSEQCTVNVQSGHLAEEKSNNCHWVLNGPSSQGCSFYADDGTFGQAFNNNGYKIVALQVEAERIRIWHFKKGEVPSDLAAGKPNPDAWTKAPSMHITPKNCDFNKAFRMFHIILNTSFCGGWAGDDWGASYAGQCKKQTGQSDCKAWVANNPKDFVDTYWEINSIKLYQRT